MASDGRNHWDDGPRIELRGDPAYRYRETDEDDGAFLESEEERPRRRRSGFGPLRLALVGLLLIGFGGLVLYAYSWGTGERAPEELPLVAGAEGPEKERPESPGGLEVPYQDTLVLNQSGEDEGEGIERLLPPPEAPQPPEPEPEPAQAPAAQAPAAQAPAAQAPAAQAPAAEAPATEAPAAGQEDPAMEEAPAGAPLDGEVEVAEVPVQGGTEAEAPAAETAPEPAPAPAAESAAEAPAAEAPAAQEQQAALPSAAGSGGFLIQLASVGDRAAVEREWGRMQSRHPEQLGSLSLNVERADLGDRGVFYRIQAGPVATREAADALCTRLKAQQQDCLVRAR